MQSPGPAGVPWHAAMGLFDPLFAGHLQLGPGSPGCSLGHPTTGVLAAWPCPKPAAGTSHPARWWHAAAGATKVAWFGAAHGVVGELARGLAV